MVFSLEYLARASKIYLDFPKLLGARLAGNSVAERLTQICQERWRRRPAEARETFGFKIFLNSEDTVISPRIGVLGVWELATTILFKRLVKPKMVVVDVGANIGWYTLLAASRIRGEGTVVSFEPEPVNFDLLVRSIAANKFWWAKPFRACVADREGKMRLYISPANSGRHSIVYRRSEKSIEVESVTLENFLSKMGVEKIDVLKVDAEGAEPLVFEGSGKYLDAVGHVVVDWDPHVWSDRTPLVKELSKVFDAYMVVNSPFLVKRVDDLSGIKFSANIYLRNRFFGRGHVF